MTKEEQLNKEMDEEVQGIVVINQQFWINAERIRNHGTIEEKESWLKVIRGLDEL